MIFVFALNRSVRIEVSLPSGVIQIQSDVAFGIQFEQAGNFCVFAVFVLRTVEVVRNDLSRNCLATSLVGVVIRSAESRRKVGQRFALSRAERNENVLDEQVVKAIVRSVDVVAVGNAFDEGIETAVKTITRFLDSLLLRNVGIQLFEHGCQIRIDFGSDFVVVLDADMRNDAIFDLASDKLFDTHIVACANVAAILLLDTVLEFGVFRNGELALFFVFDTIVVFVNALLSLRSGKDIVVQGCVDSQRRIVVVKVLVHIFVLIVLVVEILCVSIRSVPFVIADEIARSIGSLIFKRTVFVGNQAFHAAIEAGVHGVLDVLDDVFHFFRSQIARICELGRIGSVFRLVRLCVSIQLDVLSVQTRHRHGQKIINSYVIPCVDVLSVGAIQTVETIQNFTYRHGLISDIDRRCSAITLGIGTEHCATCKNAEQKHDDQCECKYFACCFHFVTPEFG